MIRAAGRTPAGSSIFRIGGPGVGKATTTLVVNSDHVIGDHMWLWRADHGDGVGWNVNTADTGLIVDGDNVTMYGLFVEHYQKYQTIWNGNGGRTYFYQNEMPYDPTNQGAWMRAFEVPNRPGVRFTNMVIVSLGGVETINRVVNNVGGPANASTQIQYWNNYP